jgi:hypothetical protein
MGTVEGSNRFTSQQDDRLLVDLINAEEFSLVEMSLEHRRDYNQLSHSGQSARHAALTIGNSSLFYRLALKRAVVRPKLPDGMHELHFAAMLGHMRICERILRETKLFPNAKN